MSQQEEDYIIFEEMSKGSGNGKPLSTEKIPIEGDYATLYDELLYRCDPARFIEPYDEKKVEIANGLYARILQNKDNLSVLKQLRSESIRELEVKFSTKNLYLDLKAICNPANYTGADYNEELLSLANRFYSQIRENADDIEKLEDIELQAEVLKKIYQEREERERLQLEEKNRIEKKRKKLESLKKELDNITTSIDSYKYVIPFVFIIGCLFILVAIMSYNYNNNYYSNVSSEEATGTLVIYGIVVVLIFLLYIFVISPNITGKYKQKKKEIEKQIKTLEQ